MLFERPSTPVVFSLGQQIAGLIGREKSKSFRAIIRRIVSLSVNPAARPARGPSFNGSAPSPPTICPLAPSPWRSSARQPVYGGCDVNRFRAERCNRFVTAVRSTRAAVNPATRLGWEGWPTRRAREGCAFNYSPRIQQFSVLSTSTQLSGQLQVRCVSGAVFCSRRLGCLLVDAVSFYEGCPFWDLAMEMAMSRASFVQ